MSGSDQTRVHSRVRVKMASGKIYGPYQRDEIIRFIRARKLTGEEEILFEGDTQWRILSSDPEFFDELQESLLGVKSQHKKKKVISGAVEKTQQSDPFFAQKENELSHGNTVTRVVDKKKNKSDKTSTNSQIKAPPSAELEGLELTQSGQEASQEEKLVDKKKRRFRFVLFFILILVGLFIFSSEKNSDPNSTSGAGVYKSIELNNQLNYTRALSEQMQLLKLPAPNPPEDLYRAEKYDLVTGFGAHHWIQAIKERLGQENKRQNAEYWLNLAWSTAWLAEIFKTFSPSEYEKFSSYSEELIEQLDRRDVFTPALETLFFAISDVSEGKWLEVIKKLSPLKNYEIAQWLVEEAYWMKYWEEDAKVKIELPGYNFEDKFLKTTSFAKKALLIQSPNTIFDIKQILYLDSQSWSAWFLLSEYNWRIKSTGVSQANRYFLTGLTVQSLFPRSYQRVYWAQYLKFRTLFGGDESLLRNIKNNFQLLGETEIVHQSNPKWSDLGTDILKFQELGSSILRQSANNELDLVDMSSLEVISRATKGNDEGIYPVIHDAIFTRKWPKAEALIRERRIKFPNDPNLLGYKIWLESERFNFEEALASLRKLEQIPGASAEALLYSGVLHVIARHYQKGRDDLAAYAKQFPQRAFSYYFLARSFYEDEKYVDCTKHANTARVHGEAVIHFQSQLLYYNCRVQATLAVDEAIKDLKQMLDLDPDSIPLNIEYVRALVNSGQDYKALKTVERVVVKFPYSYKLKMMMGQVEEKRGELPVALLLYNEARKLRPDLAETGVPIAKLYEKEGRFMEAAQQYEAAGLSDPDYPEIFLQAARAYRKAGRTEKAHRMYLKEIIERKSSMVDTFIEAAEFMLESNAPKLVPELFQKYGSSFKGDPRVTIRLAQSYMAVRDLKSAEKYALIAKGQGPKEPEPYRILGDVYEGLGQYQVAKENYEKFLYILPQSPDTDRIRYKLRQPPYR